MCRVGGNKFIFCCSEREKKAGGDVAEYVYQRIKLFSKYGRDKEGERTQRLTEEGDERG